MVGFPNAFISDNVEAPDLEITNWDSNIISGKLLKKILQVHLILFLK